MQFCVDSLQALEQQLRGQIPIRDSQMEQDFADWNKQIQEYIETTFPEGVVGIDSYDDILPDGLPSYKEFQQQCTTKMEELRKLNQSAIPEALEKVKTSSRYMFQNRINQAIQAAVQEIESDLSNDTTLAFLDDTAMAELKQELIVLAKEYAHSRLDHSSSEE